MSLLPCGCAEGEQCFTCAAVLFDEDWVSYLESRLVWEAGQ